MKLIAILLFIVSFNAFAGIDSKCAHLREDCEYYSCLSMEKNCSSDTYPLSFGRRYCLKFKELRNLSEEASTWMKDVRTCLIDEMEKFETGLSCSELKSRAFRSHVPCYVQSGFCSLSFKDKTKILRAILPALGNVQVIADGSRILKQCL